MFSSLAVRKCIFRPTLTRTASFWRSQNIARRLVLVSLSLAQILAATSLVTPSPVRAAVGINQQINFQARLANSQGATVPDGNYNLQFKIYQDGAGCVVSGTSPCGGTLKWTESWLNSSTQGVTVKNGYFSVQLGSITAFGSNVDFNSDTLWLSLNIGTKSTDTSPINGATCTPFSSCGGDGEMLPFKRFASSPYSLNSGKLGGLASSQFVQLAQGLQADSSTTAASLAINKTGGTANILQLQRGGADVQVIANDGSVLFMNQTDSAAGFKIQSALAAQTLFTADTSSNKIKIGDSTGTDTATTILQVDAASTDPTTGLASRNGGLFYNSTSDQLKVIEAGAVARVCTTSAVCAGYAASAASGNYIQQIPATTAANTIAPIAASVVALTVKGTTGTAANVLEIFDSTATPARQAYFDNTGSLNLSKQLSVATGNTFTNASSTLNTAIAIANLNYSGSGNSGTIGTAAATVNVATAFTINQVTAGQTLTVPSPSVATAGRVIYVSNIGSVSFTLLSATLSAGTTATLVWNGTVWTFAGADASSVLNQFSVPQAANFNIQATNSAANGTIGGIIRGAAGGQTVDLFQLQATNGTVLAKFDANGVLGGANGAGANVAGSALTIAGGQGTGTAAGGNILLQYAPAGATGSATNALVTACLMSGTNGSFSCPGAGSLSERFGAGSLAAGNNSVALGNGATAQYANTVSIGFGAIQTNVAGNGGGVAIGRSASSDFAGVAIGLSAVAAGNGNIAIGQNASANGPYQSTAIGAGAHADAVQGAATAIGFGADAKGQNSLAAGSSSLGAGYSVAIGNNANAGNSTSNLFNIAIGQGASTAGFSNSIVIGSADAVATGNNQAVIGSSSYSVNDVYFGKGVQNATPTAYTIHGTGGLGTNINGAALQFAGGIGTGTGTGGNILFQYAPAGLTGAAANSLVTACSISGANGSLSCPGSGTASERFGLGSSAAATDSLAIGNGASVTSGNTSSIAIGKSSSVTGPTSIAIGNSATAAGTNGAVSLGYAANAGANGVIAIGTGATSNGDESIVIGKNTSYGSTSGVVIGSAAIGNGGSSIAIGPAANGAANLSIAIGASSNAASISSIAIGAGSTTTAINQLVIGGTSATSKQISSAYFGSGVTDATPSNFTLQGTGSSTAGTAGALVTVKGGAGATTTTGSAGGGLTLQGGDAGGSGVNNGGNVSISGGAKTSTGTVGSVILQGANGGNVGIGTSGTPAQLLSIGGTTGNLTVNSSGDVVTVGNLSVSTGKTFTNASSTLNTAVALGNFNYAGSGNTGSIGTAPATVDAATAFIIAQTTTGQTLTIPSPTVTTAGRVIYISNTGSANFTMLGAIVTAGTSATVVWNGTAWTFAGADGSSILNQNSVTQTANFRISGVGQAAGFDINTTGSLNIGAGTTAGQLATALQIGNDANNSALTLSSGTGTINIGTGGQARTINIGTGAAVQGLTIGSSNTTSTTLIQGGNGVGAISVQAATSGTITIGGTAQTGNITIGSSSATQSILIGNGAGASTVSLATNATAAGTVNVGNSNAGTIATFSAGAYNLNLRNTGVGINATAPTTGSVDLFFGAGARTININQSAASTTGGSLTLNAGKSGTGAVNGGDLLLQGGASGGSGTSGSVIIKANGVDSTTSLLVQNATGTELLRADTSSMILKIGLTSAATLSGAKLLVTSAEATTAFRVGDGTNGLDFAAGTPPSSTNGLFKGTSRPTKKLTLVPEYAGAVLTGDGTNNVGTMTSDFCSGTSRLSINTANCAATDEHNYYAWTAQATNDYDVYMRYQLPSDFDGFATNTSIQMYGWRSTATEKVELAMFNASGTQCGTTTEVNSSNTTWQSTAMTGSETTDAACTTANMAAGSVIEFRIKLTVGTNNNFARAGEISFDYLSKF